MAGNQVAQRDILERATREMNAAREFVLPVHWDLPTLICLVAAIQLSLRHPRNTGPSAQIVRESLDAIIERVRAEGFAATADLMRLGDDPRYDA